MKQLLDLYQTILDSGVQQPNRTGIDTLMIPGAMLRFDLREGFPAVTTKKLAFKAIKGELIGFLRGYQNAAQFRELGCNIWDQNANENTQWLTNPNRKGTDDLGRIYGAQWTDWRCELQYDGATGNWYIPSINQVQEVLNKLHTNPTDRRMIISAWRPDEFDQMALPPCHVLYQFLADSKNKVLHLCMYQRSCDMFLGVPFNIASASLFLSVMANMSGYTAGTFTHFLADAHIYMNHLDQVKEQISRTPYDLPTLKYTGPTTSTMPITGWENCIQPDHFELVNYHHHKAIKAPMAV
jgi:thymidylate synthase